MTPDLYAHLVASLPMLGGVFDAKLPDDPWRLTDPVIVTQGISDTPTHAIDGSIALSEQRITCEIQDTDLLRARVIKQALIAALDGWRGTIVQVATFESGGPELYDADLNPPRYCLPVDFMLTF